jgi:hypothetical protein
MIEADQAGEKGAREMLSMGSGIPIVGALLLLAYLRSYRSSMGWDASSHGFMVGSLLSSYFR